MHVIYVYRRCQVKLRIENYRLAYWQTRHCRMVMPFIYIFLLIRTLTLCKITLFTSKNDLCFSSLLHDLRIQGYVFGFSDAVRLFLDQIDSFDSLILIDFDRSIVGRFSMRESCGDRRHCCRFFANEYFIVWLHSLMQNYVTHK